ncbi:hypothetical protein [Streptomyces sp. NPDC059949]|uniref:hypothetical protein n=1 Tax=Streptomyces sp. NPDC059949 TaxID=3347013 RepID=UPI003660B904
MASTRDDLQAVQDLTDAALVDYARRPSDRDIESLTGQLLRQAGLLCADVACLPGSAAVLADWETIKAAGPDCGTLGSWVYARALARVACRMLALLGVAAR